MTLDEFTAFVADSLATTNSVGPDDDLEAMGIFDSISKLMLIAAVDRRFDIMLAPQKLKDNRTPRQLFQLLDENS